MVLDAKALTWAANNDIDTAKLKKARVPIFGKWYFPEIPPGVPLVNLETGEQEVFPERMVAGEVIYVPAADLLRASLAPEGFSIRQVAVDTGGGSTRALRTMAQEPLLAMARPPGMETRAAIVPVDADQSLLPADPAALAGIHLPSASIAPFVMGLGFCIALLGAISHWIILVVGLLWMLAGSIVWIRIGLLEAGAAAAHAHGDHLDPADHSNDPDESEHSAEEAEPA
jgi:hypothetical protein